MLGSSPIWKQFRPSESPFVVLHEERGIVAPGRMVQVQLLSIKEATWLVQEWTLVLFFKMATN
jgi:hypothetical protein